MTPAATPFSPETHASIVAPVVDEFDLQQDGITVAVREPKLRAMAAQMAAREAAGEYSPLVIGHTTDAAPETAQPPLVGWLSGPWHVADYEGRKALFATHWIARTNTLAVNGAPMKLSASEVVARWPRRSAELWLHRNEIDPHCLLGATTPARPLGVLRLDARGAVAVSREFPLPPPAQESPVTTNPAPTPAAMPPDTGAMDSGSMQQILALLGALVQKIDMMGQQLAELSQPAMPQHEDDLPDDIFGDEQEPEAAKSDKPAAEPAEDKVAKLSRQLAEAEASKKRLEFRSALSEMSRSGCPVNPDDEQLLSDLVSVPAEMAARQLERLRLQRANPTGLSQAVYAAGQATGAPGKSVGQDDVAKIVRNATSKGITFEASKSELGYV